MNGGHCRRSLRHHGADPPAVIWLSVRSLEALEENLKRRNQTIKIITGHTGWTDDTEEKARSVRLLKQVDHTGK